MTPTRSTGRMPAYDSTGHELPDDVERRQRGRIARAASSADQNNVSAQRRSDARQQRLPQRARRLLLRQLQGHRRPATTSYTYQMSNFGVPGIPANLQGPVGTANTPRIQISNFDTTETGLRPARLQPRVQGRPPAQGRLGRAPLGERRGRVVSGRLRRTCIGASRSAARRPARPAPAPTATTGWTTSPRAARSARTSRTCTSRTRGRSAHG